MAALDVASVEADLVLAFGQFMMAFGAAAEAGVDAGAVITANLRSTLGEDAWADLPLSVKMLLG